ncbi:MAG: grasp-with-spasm system SPASM domain peptide maturase [Saprospiraceae bacterium]
MDETSNFDFKKLFEELSSLGAFSVELRFYFTPNLKLLKQILNKTKGLRIRNIELVLPYGEEIKFEVFSNIFYDFGIVSKIVIYDSPRNIFKVCDRGINYIYLTQMIVPNTHCGNIHKDYFSINLDTFTESQHHNTCLNRKISIDQNGNIKNCPSMTESYGNIATTTLQEALDHPDFKKYWNIKKDQINVCQDCEFRHICTDCELIEKILMTYIQNRSNVATILILVNGKSGVRIR